MAPKPMPETPTAQQFLANKVLKIRPHVSRTPTGSARDASQIEPVVRAYTDHPVRSPQHRTKSSVDLAKYLNIVKWVSSHAVLTDILRLHSSLYG